MNGRRGPERKKEMDKKVERGTETSELLSITSYDSLRCANSQEEKILSIEIRKSALIFFPFPKPWPFF